MNMPANRAGTHSREPDDTSVMEGSLDRVSGSGGGVAALAGLFGVVNVAPHWGQRSRLCSGTGRDERSAARHCGQAMAWDNMRSPLVGGTGYASNSHASDEIGIVPHRRSRGQGLAKKSHSAKLGTISRKCRQKRLLAILLAYSVLGRRGKPCLPAAQARGKPFPCLRCGLAVKGFARRPKRAPRGDHVGDNDKSELQRHFGLLQATALNMTTIIGAGVFITIPLMLEVLPGPYAMIGWLAAGVLVLVDSLVWSELGATLPGSVGSYLYLLEC